MKLQNLHLTNFRNHGSSSFVFDKPVNFFVGRNASGKTSVLEAITFLYTGRTSISTKIGEGLQRLISTGESMSIVSGNLDDIGKITRSIPHDLVISDWEGSLTKQQDKLYEILGAKDEEILCSLNTTMFSNMDHKKQKEFMFRMFASVLSIDMLKKVYIEWAKLNGITKDIDGAPEYVYLWKTYVPTTISGDGFKAIDEIYNHAFSERKQLKRMLKEMESYVANYKVTTLPMNLTPGMKDGLIKKQKELSEIRNSLYVKMGSVNAMEKRKAELDKIIASASTLTVVEETVDVIATLLNTVQIEETKNRKKVSEIDGKIAVIDKQISQLQNFSGKCPISDKLKCPMAAKDVEVMITNLKGEKIVLEEHLKTFTETLTSLQNDLRKLKTKHENRIKYDLSFVTIANAKNELTNILSNPDFQNSSDLKPNIEKVDKEISTIQNDLALLDKDLSIRTMLDEYNVKIKKYENSITAYDTLVNAFGSSGVKSIFLNTAIQNIKDKLNENMNLITGGKYTIDVRINEDDFNIYVNSNGKERHIDSLSSSEKMRVGMVLQISLNMSSKLKTIAFDNLEILDSDNRIFFWNIIKKVYNNFDRIFIFATTTSIKPSNLSYMNTFILGDIKTE